MQITVSSFQEFSAKAQSRKCQQQKFLRNHHFMYAQLDIFCVCNSSCKSAKVFHPKMVRYQGYNFGREVLACRIVETCKSPLFYFAMVAFFNRNLESGGGGGLYKKSGIAPYFLELLVSLSNLNIAVAVYILGGWQKIQSILGDTFMGTSLLCISYAKIVL